MKPESDCENTREGGCARLESGTAFMPGVSEKRLEKAARKEKDKCAKFRLLACLARKRGYSIRRIVRDLETAYSTIRDWLLRMCDRGLKGRFNARPKGRRAKLPPPRSSVPCGASSRGARKSVALRPARGRWTW